MGWLSEGHLEAHEGWAAFLTRDGRIWGSSSVKGVHRLEQVDGAWSEETVPWSEVIGWRTACTCDWTGSTWLQTDTGPGPARQPTTGDSPVDAEEAYLPDGSTVEERGRAEWEAHLAPLSRLAHIKAAAAELAQARARLDEAVGQARTEPPLSWTEIGQAAGMSRQSAHERWGGR